MFENDYMNKVKSSVSIVETELQAKELLEKIRALPEGSLFGCDTEVADIDLSRQSPVGNGVVTCVSMYAGKYKDFGNGPYIWVDTYGKEKEGIMLYLREFFEDERYGKIWHNYGFDRHVLYNHGIDAKGFAGDTMHMARVLDSSLDKKNAGGGYSLEGLSEAFLNQGKKIPMKQLFGVGKTLQNGTESKVRILPSVDEIQLSPDPELRAKWIWYSVYDADCTYELYQVFKRKMQNMKWEYNRDLFEEPQKRTDGQASENNMFQLYERFIKPFGEILTDIERAGFQLDIKHLQNIETRAQNDLIICKENFKRYINKTGCFESRRDVEEFNPASTLQKQFMLFAKNGLLHPSPSALEKLQYSCFLRPKGDNSALNGTSKMGLEKLMEELEKFDPKPAVISVENTIGYLEPGQTVPKKNRDIRIKGLGVEAKKFTPTGWPSVSNDVLLELAGDPDADPPRYGPLAGKKKDPAGIAACKAIYELTKSGATEKFLSTFIRPLQEMSLNNRVHCSLNMNTETGRLSSRTPNLQNQPALSKDIYQIRKAFVAKPGCKLIVADYGQLELRVLAHLSKCQSMIEAFKLGGDFHSRTAVSMYDYIGKEICNKSVLLEWDSSTGELPPVPLVKDKYSNERKRAKALNFSIAYGKTSFGLAIDLDVSKTEAQETIDKWYDSRPEVKDWQERMKREARQTQTVFTIWGRRRQLPGIVSSSEKSIRAAERAAINSPIQGSAADIVMGAMIKLSRNERLRELGWKMVLQIHDEIIMEGPEESVEEAQNLMTHDMENPLDFSLLVDLTVDAKNASNWYEAK